MKYSVIASLILLPVLGFAAAKELEGVRAPAEGVCPSPEEAAKKMSVPEGFEVRCFAHEPMIVNPVAMTWDHRGRLWVVEGYEYPDGSPFKNEAFGAEAKDDQYHPVPEICKAKDNPLNAMRADHPKIPKDRIVILEDTDGDGVADKRTVFLEGLDMGSAILCGDGGVYVGQQPHLMHFKDTDGDDHADEWRVVLTGFGREDTHELVNSFCWGPDGWLYMTHGVFTNSKVRRPGVPLDKGFKFDAGIGRCKPLTGDFEVFADGTSNPWGCDYDARGNFFVSACVIDHFFHMAPGGIYVRQGGAPENPYSYELLPSIVTHKHFRAAYAGVQIYQGGVYPQDTWGHAFIGNIHDNAIHEEVLTPVGATFKCEPRRDFLRANDGWFRPVSTQTGPDGNLWVMDWCDKYPCYQNAKANPVGVDRDKGRIWRVVYTGARTLLSASADKPSAASKENANTADKSVRAPLPSPSMDLSKLTIPELVELLGHSNNWMRRMARRMLVERGSVDLDQVKEMNEVVRGEAASLERTMETFWALHSICSSGEKSEWFERYGLPDRKEHKEPAVRAWAARLAGERGGEACLMLGTTATDKELAVRLATAIALRQFSGVRLTKNEDPAHSERYALESLKGIFSLREIAGGVVRNFGNVSDPILTYSVWMAIEPILVSSPKEWLKLCEQLIVYDQPLFRVLTYKSMRRLCDIRDAKNLDLAIDFIEKITAHEVLLTNALDGLEKGQEAGIIKPTKDTTAFFAKLATHQSADVRKHAQNLATLWGDPAAIRQLAVKLLDTATPEAERVAALQTLRKVKTDDARTTYAKLLNSKPTPELLQEALRAAGDLGGAETPVSLVALWKTLPPALRTAAAEALIARTDWGAKLLDAVEEKKITRGELPITTARYFANQPDAVLKKRAEELIGAWKESNADTKALIAAKRKSSLEGEPDLAAGKLIFTATCMVCHSFHGGGQKVGPDLIGSGRSNLDALLANVIDPNQIIGNGYENIIVTTKDNRTVSGRMTEDTPSYVKLLAIGGAEQVVARDQIATLTNTHQSVMPQGFGGLPDDVFRNLVWYVLSPPEEGPLTPEKKKMLSQGVEGAEAVKKKGTNWHAIDWESVSLWNPQWKVEAPEFDNTPVKLTEFHGRKNVLLMHPFTKDKPSALERKVKVEKDKMNKLSFYVASHDQGDWELHVKIGDEVVKKEAIDHAGERWKHVEVDLSSYAGKEITVRLEGAATGWHYEFGYWSDITLE
jgi:putative membrane-bound dehydrogenase-like protein